jgi:hypothetical protein
MILSCFTNHWSVNHSCLPSRYFRPDCKNRYRRFRWLAEVSPNEPNSKASVDANKRQARSLCYLAQPPPGPRGMKLSNYPYLRAIQPRVYPISANLIKASARRKYFVPEGQHDSSLARSAWDSVQRANRPVGYSMIGRSKTQRCFSSKMSAVFLKGGYI